MSLLNPLVQLLDGTDLNYPLHEADLGHELAQWGQGKFPLLGEPEFVTLTNSASTAQLATGDDARSSRIAELAAVARVAR